MTKPRFKPWLAGFAVGGLVVLSNPGRAYWIEVTGEGPSREAFRTTYGVVSPSGSLVVDKRFFGSDYAFEVNPAPTGTVPLLTVSPGMFAKEAETIVSWSDETHLTLAKPAGRQFVNQLTRMGQVEVSYGNYVRNQIDLSKDNLQTVKLTGATYSAHTLKPWSRDGKTVACIIDVEGRDELHESRISFEFVKLASSNHSWVDTAPYAGRFAVAHRLGASAHLTLTQAALSTSTGAAIPNPGRNALGPIQDYARVELPGGQGVYVSEIVYYLNFNIKDVERILNSFREEFQLTLRVWLGHAEYGVQS